MSTSNWTEFTIRSINTKTGWDAPESWNTSVSAVANYSDDHWYQYVHRTQTVVIPIVCVLGLVGNSMAAGAFLSPALKKTSCCLHLATKSIADIVFLLSLFVMWLYRLHVPIFTVTGVCQSTVYVTYVGGFLSVWFVVVITAENFVRLSLPSQVPTWCSVARAKCIMCILIAASVIIYSFSLWTTGLIRSNGTLICLSLEVYEDIVMAMTYVDSILTLIIPLVVMVILNVVTVIAAIRAHRRRKRLFQSMNRCSSRTRRGMGSPGAKVSELLFAVSIIFIILHTPSHVIRIKMIVLQTIYHEGQSLSDMILQRVFEIMYFLNFSVHCGVYLAFGDNFRSVFCKLYLPQYFKTPPERRDSYNKYCKRGSDVKAI